MQREVRQMYMGRNFEKIRRGELLPIDPWQCRQRFSPPDVSVEISRISHVFQRKYVSFMKWYMKKLIWLYDIRCAISKSWYFWFQRIFDVIPKNRTHFWVIFIHNTQRNPTIHIFLSKCNIQILNWKLAFDTVYKYEMTSHEQKLEREEGDACKFKSEFQYK